MNLRQELLILIMDSRGAGFRAYRRCKTFGDQARYDVDTRFRFPLIVFGPFVLLLRLPLVI